MAIDQQRVGDVLGDDTGLVYVHVVNVVHDVDAATLASVCWLHDPHILLALVLLQLLVVVVEVTELVRQNVSVRAEVESALSESLLQAHDIEAKSVLASDFIALWEVIDLLILVQAFILVRFARARAPQNVPLM